MNTGNTFLGAVSGLVGGIAKYFTSIPVHDEYWIKLVEAGGTALVCGFLGVAGKECYVWIKSECKNLTNKKPKV